MTLNQYAAAHQAKHGYPPLIIGREYRWDDLEYPVVTLAEADDNNEWVSVRPGDVPWTTSAHAKELHWLPDDSPDPLRGVYVEETAMQHRAEHLERVLGKVREECELIRSLAPNSAIDDFAAGVLAILDSEEA